MHIPVLAAETVELLNPRDGKTYLDCTLGFGGHAQKLKAQNLKLKIIGIDQDKEALESARKNLAGYEGIEYIYGNFAGLDRLVKQKVDGIIYDLGVSSYQIDSAGRGFSFRHDGELDMRMDQNRPKTAAHYLLELSEAELAKVFFEYGEERFSRRIARLVKEKLPLTTYELKTIVEKAIPGWRKRESVARVFQALRILVNSELENLKISLPQAVNLLNPGGRIVVISYHSLEDRIVKQFFREMDKNAILKIITKKPVCAGEEEAAKNPRSKSAKLRAAEKI